ncbi:type VI secretion system Vgr family protein [Dechloromonas sp. A34]|uniref:type VI secretion system Vgr family protein n=1 Tax=Dechloromonas sp. A34 TaxID=447588 RepID=UPI002248A9BA|nr:type VI secretion system Vgr family protein [Dechloromonas sp. A34]
MLPLFTADTRLYELTWRDEAGPALTVEAWWGTESLSAGFEYCIDVLSTDAFIDDERLLGRALTLHTRLSDGSANQRSAYVRTALSLGSDGGFARYRLIVVPWLWFTTRSGFNRVFQEKTVQQIIDLVFAGYPEVAAWRWSDEVAAFMSDTRPRSYCVQFSESDYQFLSRLLAEEGLGWKVEEDKEAPGSHRVTIFADSREFPEDVLSQSANGGRGIRFHRADSQEEQDAVLAFGEQRQLLSGMTTVLTWDYKAKKSVATSVPTALALGGAHAPVLEAYDDAGPYAFASSAEAERYARLAMEAHEARYRTWLGRGTVRSLTVGTRVDLIGLPGNPANPEADHRYAPKEVPLGYAITEVTHVGINNLSGEAIASVAQRLAQRPWTGDDATLANGDIIAPVHAPAELPGELLALAGERGYGNSFTALHSTLPWRVRLVDDSGARLNPRPTAPGPMSAIVVGPNGETSASGADEIWCDGLNRIKIRYHWQQGETVDDQSSCWVRVMTRQAGTGMGMHWLPRIGQEVLVDFLNGDLDRPYVLGTLYNGKGEGGVPATPGGNPGESDTAVFEQASDHRPSGQGNLAAGNSPAWHGAAADSHRHAAALTGLKSKEFGGSGYNQLVMDDTDQQQRVQLKSSQHASELNLGHLVHQADNYRGSFRGTGTELRTDAWGALRAGRGIVMSTWCVGPGEAAGDMAPAMALLKQAASLARTLSDAAGTHRTVKLAAAIGSTGPDQSVIDDGAAPLNALHKVSSGMVDAKDQDAVLSDAQAKNTATSQGKVPHLTEAAIIQAAKAGFGTVAGQNLQYTNGETTTFESAQDSNFAVAGKARIHAGQAIGLLAGAIQAGEGNTGIKLIAAKDDIDLQAQSDEMKFQAKKEMKLVSVNAHIDFAAAKKIHLAVQGGASITIDGGIIVQCPGTITVHASKKSFSGPTSLSREMNTWPQSQFDDPYTLYNESTGEPLANCGVELIRMDGTKLKIATDANGKTPIQKSEFLEMISVRIIG